MVLSVEVEAVARTFGGVSPMAKATPRGLLLIVVMTMRRDHDHELW